MNHGSLKGTFCKSLWPSSTSHHLSMLILFMFEAWITKEGVTIMPFTNPTNTWRVRSYKIKSCSFPPPHIATIVWFHYISTTIGHLKFVSGLLHLLMVNIVHSYYIHYVIHLGCSHTNWMHCNQKREEHPECFRVPCLTPLGPSYVLSEAQFVCLFPLLATARGLLCRSTQCNLRSHRWRVRTSCLTTQQTIRPVTSDWNFYNASA